MRYEITKMKKLLKDYKANNNPPYKISNQITLTLESLTGLYTMMIIDEVAKGLIKPEDLTKILEKMAIPYFKH